MSLQRQKSSTGDKGSLEWLESYKRVRKNWGAVKPVTQILKSKKKYNRKKEKAKFRRELNG